VGASFGGNYLIRYLINQKRSSIKGLVALAPPFDIKQVIDEMPPMYQKFFVRNYINNSVVRHS
jgi:predicted alpha/beta-fold hydrolase